MKAKNFIQQLFDIGYERYFGVPDSLLSSLSKSLDFDFDKIDNLIASNEGSLSMAMGYNCQQQISSYLFTKFRDWKFNQSI